MINEERKYRGMVAPELMVEIDNLRAELNRAEQSATTWAKTCNDALRERDEADGLLMGCTPERARPMAAWYDRVKALLKERGKL